MTKKIKVAIIGTGGIAHVHSKVYHKIPEVEMVGLCDIVPGKAQKFAKEEGWDKAKTYRDHEKLLHDLEVDAVSVCTPHAFHAEVSINCLEAGVNVLCEKPMSVTLEQAVKMARAAKDSGKILTIGFQPRYDPNIQLMNEIVQSGRLGKIYYVETCKSRRRFIPGGTFISEEEAGIGAIGDIGCYGLDMVLKALEYPEPLTVSAEVTDYFGKSEKYSGGDWDPEEFQVEDFGVGFVRLAGDITLCTKTSWAMHLDSLGHTFYLGTEAALKCKNGSPDLTLYHDLENLQVHTPIPKKNHNIIPFDEKIKDFIRAVKENDEAPIPGSEIIYNQAIIDGMIKSAERGKEVEIKVPQI
ncbi:MAG: Gfo/Idh/MocA family protein [Halanaerobiaceae bacterium]